jgi:uncharacterized protein (TIGR02391 family)
LAPLLLRYLSTASPQEMGLYNFTLNCAAITKAGSLRENVEHAFAEAWMVLHREGLIAPKPNDSTHTWIFITRRGWLLLKQSNFDSYYRGHLLPASALDPDLATKIRPIFLRGEYDTAVFAAFKEVEVRVRVAAAMPFESLGTVLMREAFDAERGPLTDQSKPIAERQAAAHLFAGAIGLFKNPASHRAVAYSASEAADLIRLANYLILWLNRIMEIA